MLYGIISIFIIVSFWGLISMTGLIFGIDLKNTPGGNVFDTLRSASSSPRHEGFNLDATLQPSSD
jgi:hypothetical protein